MKYLNLALLVLLIITGCVFKDPKKGGCIGCKPVIYLYPTEEIEVTVQLALQGTLDFIYPEFYPGSGVWKVEAQPDGTLVNLADGKEYPYLFWEGTFENCPGYGLNSGFVVEGGKTVEFLEATLDQMGLIPEEYNEFIVYWGPRMQNNPYNLIHFAGTEYDEVAELTITPEPDSILRVFMVFSSLNRKIEVTPQEIIPFEREGFTVVEWGGTEINYIIPSSYQN